MENINFYAHQFETIKERNEINIYIQRICIAIRNENHSVLAQKIFTRDQEIKKNKQTNKQSKQSKEKHLHSGERVKCGERTLFAYSLLHLDR